MRRPPARLKLVAREPALLLRFLVERGGVTEAVARAAIERGGAYVRGRRVRDPEAPVFAGDEVEAMLREGPAQPALGRERILHLDELVVAVDKPAFVLAQEGRAGGQSLPELCAELIGGPALLVHRLDRGTTGVTVLARTKAAQAALLEEFRERRAKKEYRLLVAGQPPQDEGVIDLPLGPGEGGARRVDPQGEPARTRYRVLARHAASALIAAFPETGRTHQLRVHFRELGCPLLGDARYGGPLQLTRPTGERLDFARPLLHARSLEVAHPRGGVLRVVAEEPADFLDAAARLASSD